MTHQPPTEARRWARVQAWSGLIFLGFAALHLLNTAFASLGPTAYNGFQRALRPVYQFPAVELGLILAPLVVHVTAAVMRIRLRRGERAPSSLRTRVHRYAGYVLLSFVFGHIAATRLPSLLNGIYPEFEGVAYTFQFLPQWFYVYYPALALAGVLHAALGLPLALGVLGVRVPGALRKGPGLWLPAAGAAALVLLGVAAVGGLLFAVPDLSQRAFAVLVRRVAAQLTGGLLGG